MKLGQAKSIVNKNRNHGPIGAESVKYIHVWTTLNGRAAKPMLFLPDEFAAAERRAERQPEDVVNFRPWWKIWG